MSFFVMWPVNISQVPTFPGTSWWHSENVVTDTRSPRPSHIYIFFSFQIYPVFSEMIQHNVSKSRSLDTFPGELDPYCFASPWDLKDLSFLLQLCVLHGWDQHTVKL